ncbi:MAG: guanylate kinase [Candidatus Omnitrophica bacterium]|nr:guanylate kinase [Candidatus Omnitrophota bacterium]
MGTIKQSGTLLVISAPSGAGKTTLCNRLVAALPRLKLSVSMTTRQRRAGEQDGVNYLFVTPEQFRAAIKADGLLEYAQVFGNFYGTPRSFVERHLARGIDVVLNIDVQGALQVRRKFRRQAVFIFILPPSLTVLRQRLCRRGTDSAAEIKRRLAVARREMKFVRSYDYAVVNDDLDEAVAALSAIVIATRCKVDKGGEGNVYGSDRRVVEKKRQRV